MNYVSKTRKYNTYIYTENNKYSRALYSTYSNTFIKFLIGYRGNVAEFSVRRNIHNIHKTVKIQLNCSHYSEKKSFFIKNQKCSLYIVIKHSLLLYMFYRSKYFKQSFWHKLFKTMVLCCPRKKDGTILYVKYLSEIMEILLNFMERKE